jgi:hypothetical protein
MSTKIDRLWPKMALQPSGQFFKWGISKLPTGQFLFLLGGWSLKLLSGEFGQFQVGGSVVLIPNNVRNF